MSQEFVMGSGGVPVGSYRGQFLGIEPFTGNAEATAKYGAGLSLRWKIIGGEHDGCEASRICSPKLTPKSTLTKFAVALKGGQIAAGERFSFANYVGATGMLLVEATDSGSTRVAAFIREQPQPTQPTVNQQLQQQAVAQWEATQQQARETF